MIPKTGIGACGQQAIAGHYVVTSAGHLVLIPPLTPLKPGFRWATEADINPQPKKAVEAPKVEKRE